MHHDFSRRLKTNGFSRDVSRQRVSEEEYLTTVGLFSTFYAHSIPLSASDPFGRRESTKGDKGDA